MLTTVALVEFRKNWARTAGKVSRDWPKMIGIMPAMFTIKGSVPFTGIDMRLPTRRPGYMTGTLRRPSWT